MKFLVLFVFLFLSIVGVLAEQRGKQVEPTNIRNLISRTNFDNMFPNRADESCDGSSIYTYDAFIEAADQFGGFGTTGEEETRKREIAAFLAQTAYATAGGPENTTDDPYSWGYCRLEEQNTTLNDYCVTSTNWPCTTDQKYYGRGPIQLRYNTYYGRAGSDLGLDVDLLNDPNELVNNAVISFKSALWYWTNSHSPNPSCHDVMTNQWVRNLDDVIAGRVEGFGLTTNIIDGENECGIGTDERVEKRIGFYTAFCDILGVSYGDNLDCYSQKPYNWSPCNEYLGGNNLIGSSV